MEKDELIYNATVAIVKSYDYETMMYSDYMYGNEKSMDEVWVFYEECMEIGKVAFKEKYADCKFYSGF